MAYVDWEFKGQAYANCICDYGCPCQFNALPTHGNCEAVVGYRIERGHFGETQLDGLRAAQVLYWPGAVHEGNGSTQVIIDERANEAQREALLKIMYGEETEPFATMFNVFMSTMTTVHDPIFAPIEFEVDIEKREARLVVEGQIESSGEPIRNPVTGQEHRVRINQEAGFEYIMAEMGSGTSKSTGVIPMELSDSYGQFNEVHLNPYGIVR